jgi:hypothetical protein
MIVYRIEHPFDGKGIFTSKTPNKQYYSDISPIINDMLNEHVCSFPCPEDDKEINRPMEYYEFCAFKSLKDIKKYISKIQLNELARLGFIIYELEIIKGCIGEYQVLFHKEDITKQQEIIQH